MFVGESLGSHSLHSFAEFLQHHIHSTEANSCLTSKRKPFTILKPIFLNIMATEKSARKGGRQRRGDTAKDLPPDPFEMYKQILKKPMVSARPESNGFEDTGPKNGSSTICDC